MTDTRLTHFNEEGRAHMVDVTDKNTSDRSATAAATLRMNAETMELIRQGKLKKGDVLAVAQVAGIMAAKKTSELIPMCHPLPLTKVDISFQERSETEMDVLATVKTTYVTGVEMEALTAVTATALTVYDMCKAVDKGMVIAEVRLLEKTGGKSGDFHRA
ncbi:cyclic pyranopterin monophosphate synthase MoaC [Tumebacillus permanentifrigoris]|uniref:Cyclic pyranopterin monophosphate synthase n=1 Tax=Tumebacillus permanentifrigoris TaxID=378543 RepID=A0A316D4Z7_9BACL|nr:cyclic pyranopterin monophosphate synthase MoaC [Tumebacillus permanentifrigoris]PWK05187.1 cyclic pyranopterin monophosphate synthase subunit MoaC [Tumebacillus permanentifrigoris]